MAKHRLEPETYIEGILKGDRVILSQAITLVESTLKSDTLLARKVVKGCLPHTGNSFRIGITGVPGVGKSTFIDTFGTKLTGLGFKVAVMAIDPSSTLTRGSILGDKTRMNRLSMDPNAYIRPSPTGGSLGGVAQKTREATLLCEAAGYDLIIVETVGVGQSEIAVHNMTDAFLLLLLPNAGDELQGIKKGIMEMADVLVINKSDGAYLPGARKAKAGFSQAMRLFPNHESGWQPPVLLASSTEEKGLDEIWDSLLAFKKLCMDGPWWQSQRESQAVFWLKETIITLLEQSFYSHAGVKEKFLQYKNEVRSQELSPIQAAEELIRFWRESKDQA